MNIVIIEDEKHIAEDLAATLLSIDASINIRQIIPSVVKGNTFFTNDKDYDLIFSDIQLGDGLSFDIFRETLPRVPVIFCTAFNEYALEAFKVNGIGYILKPFSTKSVREALEKYKILSANFKNQETDLQAVLQAVEKKMTRKTSSLLVKQGDKIIPLSLEDVALFYSEDGYSFAHTFTGKRYITSQSLEQLEQICASDYFRANRQFLVNRNAIKDVSQYFNRKLLINLNFSYSGKITVGKVKASTFLRWLSEN